MSQIVNSQDQKPQSPVKVEEMSGYDEGEKLSTGEVIKGSYDLDGVLIGWHKVQSGSSD